MQDTPKELSLEQQKLVEETAEAICSALRIINAEFQNKIHVKLVTMVDMAEDKCQKCITNNVPCARAILGYECK